MERRSALVVIAALTTLGALAFGIALREELRPSPSPSPASAEPGGDTGALVALGSASTASPPVDVAPPKTAPPQGAHPPDAHPPDAQPPDAQPTVSASKVVAPASDATLAALDQDIARFQADLAQAKAEGKVAAAKQLEARLGILLAARARRAAELGGKP